MKMIGLIGPIMLLIGQEHCDAPVFNTTRLHAEAAVTLALGRGDQIGWLSQG